MCLMCVCTQGWCYPLPALVTGACQPLVCAGVHLDSFFCRPARCLSVIVGIGARSAGTQIMGMLGDGARVRPALLMDVVVSSEIRVGAYQPRCVRSRVKQTSSINTRGQHNNSVIRQVFGPAGSNDETPCVQRWSRACSWGARPS